MKQMEANIRCACCGNSTNTKQILSRYVYDMYIDGKPMDLSGLQELQICPKCMYCSFDIEKISDGVKEKVSSEEYRTLSETAQDYSAQIDAALFLETDLKKRSMLLINKCWYLEFEGKEEKAKDTRSKLVETIINDLEGDVDINEIILLCDSLRQLGKFDDAQSLIEELYGFIDESANPDIIRIVQSEKKWVLQKDSDAKTFSQMK